MTNPDNVGGLPSQHGMARRLELAADRIAERAPEDNARLFRDAAQCIQTLFNVKEALQGELCRAAPAGGDEDSLFTPAEHLAACREDWQRVCDALGANGQHMDPDDVLKAIGELSAPAGSGEVDQQVRWLRVAIDEEKEKPGVYQRPWMIATYEAAIAALLRKLQQGAE